MHKRLKLMDPLPADGGGAPTITNQQAAATTTQTPGTGFNPPVVEDDFLSDTVPPVVPPSEEKPVVEAVKPAETVVVPPTTYSPEQVAALVKANGAPAPVVQPQRQLTQDEIDTQLNTYKPVAQDLQDLLSGDEPKALAAISRIGAALVKNAVTVASILQGDRLAEFQRSVQPHIEFAQAQQQQAAQATYFHDNPTHVGLEPLVAQVAQQMATEKFKGTPTDTFKEVGKRVDALVARLKIPVSQPGGATTPSPAVPAPARMSTVSTGGQGGAGGTGVTKPADPEAGIWS